MRKESTLAWSRWEASTMRASSALSWSCWAWRSVSWVAIDWRRGSASLGPVLPVRGDGLGGLALQLGRRALQLLGLELDPLAGGGHVGHGPAHLLQHLQ